MTDILKTADYAVVRQVPYAVFRWRRLTNSLYEQVQNNAAASGEK